MQDLKQLLEKYKLGSQLKVFAISMTAGFLMVILPTFGINKILPNFYSVAAIANPMPKTIDPLENIYPKLGLKENNFKIEKPTTSVLAATANDTETVADYQNANAYAVIDFNSGKVIDQKKLSEKVSIASLTKIMTAVVALDLSRPEDLFTISKTAADMEPTKIGVVEGQKMTLEELLESAILTSANDAVEAIREGVDTQYNNEVFIKSMNAKAKFLKLENTHFENPQGFDGNKHYSSAEDLAILTHYALTKYPLIAELAAKEYAFLEADENHKQFDLYNWNGLLGVYPNTTGVKIGNTGKAQKTTIVVSERQGKKVLVVLLGAPGTIERDLWASQLLDLGFEKEHGLAPIEITEEQLKEKYKTWKYWE